MSLKPDVVEVLSDAATFRLCRDDVAADIAVILWHTHTHKEHGLYTAVESFVPEHMGKQLGISGIVCVCVCVSVCMYVCMCECVCATSNLVCETECDSLILDESCLE